MIQRKILSFVYEPTENPLTRITYEELKRKLLPQYNYIYEGQEYGYLTMVLKLEEFMEKDTSNNALELSKNISVILNRQLFTLNDLDITKKKEKLSF